MFTIAFMQQIITVYNFVLLPVYVFIFYLIVRKKSKKYEQMGLRKIFITAFWLRMAGAIGYSLLIQYYYGYGDTFGYYLGGNVLRDMIQHDITSVKYLFAPAKDIVAAAKAMGFADAIPESMPNDSNVSVMKLSAILSYFTFNKYLLIAACFGFFSFVGIWKLFYVFYQLNKKKNVKLLAFFVLYFPSLWFWGSGLLKEPLCVGALGIIIYLIYKNFIQKKISIGDIIILLLMLYILTIIKNYITAILLVSILVVLIYKLIGKIKHFVFRMIITFLLLLTTIITILTLDISPYINSGIEIFFSRVQLMQTSYQQVNAENDKDNSTTFLLSDLTPTAESILINSPEVIATTLFRPFVWEAKKIIILLAAIEALLVLLLTLYIIIKTKFIWFFTYIFTDSVLLFCFIFSILFALIIGFTTFNFGTLIRYKIIFLPFYFFLIVSIYSKYQNRHL